MAESIFVEIDADQNYVRAIVVTQDILDTGLWGDTDKWVTLAEYEEIQAQKKLEEEEDGDV